MKITGSILVAIGSLVCGCTESHDRDVTVVEPNDLGITELEVRHERVQDDRVLTVRGFDQAGETIATAVLRTGMVMYGADVPEQPSAGTELTLTVRDRVSSFVSPDRIPHMIFEPLSVGAATFVALKGVASEIDKEAGIKFAPPRSTGGGDEIPFAAANCSGSRFPINKGGATQCCQDDANTWHRNAAAALVNRFTYAPAFPSIPVCRKSDGTIGCTGAACLYGPCGSAIGTISGTNARIFHPTSQPTVCGRDDGAGSFTPEQYVAQTLYGSMTATCSCTGCNTDGTPQCGFFDDFNRTTGLGSNWFVQAGSWITDGAYAVSQTAGDNYARSEPTAALGTADYSVQTIINAPATSAVTAVFGRYDKNNPTLHYYAASIAATDNYIVLRRRDSGTWTWLWQTITSVNASVDHDLKLVATGSNPVRLQVWLDGQMKVQYDDSSAGRLTVGGQGGLFTGTSGIKYNQASLDPLTAIAAPPGLPFVDDFNRTGTNLGNWIGEWGSFTTDGTRAVANTTVDDSFGYWAQPVVTRGTEDYSVQADVQVPSSSAGAGVFARATSDGSNGAATTASVAESYTAKIKTTGVTLARISNYGSTTLGTYNTTLTTGTDYTVKLVATGSNPVHLEVWLNGTQRITYDDSNAARHPSGNAGICTSNNSTSSKWNSFRIDAAGSNTPPTVSAGSDQTITLPAAANLDGTITDDGLPTPPAATTASWTTVSGPGTVTFGNASAVDTTATFSVAGVYVLRLTGSDSVLSTSDDVQITVNSSGGGTTTIDRAVAASADDAEEDASNGSMNISSSDLELVNDGSINQRVGMRFANMTIPVGATITKAYVQFTVDETVGGTGLNMTIKGFAHDNTPAFTTSTNNINSRSVTTASATGWNPPLWTSVGAAGVDQQTPELKTIVQEIVNRAGWASGNALGLVVTGPSGVRTAGAYDNGIGSQPVLHVEYTGGGGGGGGGGGSQTLYAESLASGWTASGSSTTVDTAYSNAGWSHTGTFTIQATYNSAFGSCNLNHAGFNTTGLSTVDFYVWIGTGASSDKNLSIQAYLGGVAQTKVTLAPYCDYSTTLPRGLWAHCAVPLTAIGASNVSNLTRIALGENSNSSGYTAYFDDITLYGGTALNITTTGDARVESGNGNSNFGTLDLQLDIAATNGDIRSYLKFPISLPGGSIITSARLKVRCYNGATNGFKVYASANSTWGESTITWNNQPGSTGGALVDLSDTGAVDTGNGTWIWIPLATATIPISGTFSVVMMPDDTDGLDFFSKEDASQPVLELTYQ